MPVWDILGYFGFVWFGLVLFGLGLFGFVWVLCIHALLIVL